MEKEEGEKASTIRSLRRETTPDTVHRERLFAFVKEVVFSNRKTTPGKQESRWMWPSLGGDGKVWTIRDFGGSVCT